MLDAVVIGAGHAGLAASQRLRESGLEHVVLERGEIGESWRSQRWSSFTLNTPNVMNRLPGSPYRGDQPQAFESRDAWVARLERYVAEHALPVRTHAPVTSVERDGVGEAKGAPDHPHRGFETVTYMIDGEFVHRDSTGGGGIIANGDTQWMTAGAGIVHSEMPPEKLVRSGGLFHGVQLWVNLPAAQKFSPPGYQDIAASSVTLLRSRDGGALVRVIAGALAEHHGPGVTQTPITYAHVTLAPGSRLEVPWRPDFNGLVYALGGFGSVGAESTPLQSGQLAILGAGDAIRIEGGPLQDSRTPSFDVLLLGGRPIGEPVVQYGPFVMNTREEILQAVADYQSGKIGSIPATHFGAGPKG